jgi:HPt (histidine-containing phosphotransfer) domain-containing protein
MITIFLEQNPSKIKLLKEGVLNKDFAAIKNASHFLKSSFAIMGLRCANCLSEIESLSIQSNDIEKIIPLSNTVMLNFNESVIEYEKILSEIQLKNKR